MSRMLVLRRPQPSTK